MSFQWQSIKSVHSLYKEVYIMTLLINLILLALIVGYSVFVLVRYVKRSKQGKCSACESNKHCPTESLPKHLQS
ncbi:FeoB-associated Cys-rich membrane protein [Staphylococcus sp. IVB6233]|uniref:FeoB-associated Cys-rich membrane protein n=1 Tax=unclassified Staphylococcus TaxID=91994 RepID=UPI0031F78352